MTRHIVSTLIAAYQLFSTGLSSANSGYQPPSQPPRSGGGGQGESASGLAIATLALGIGAWTYFPILGAWIGVITGWIELKRIERGESPAAGETFAKIGFWLSVASIVFSVLGSCAAIALILFVYGSLAALLTGIGLAGAV
jgi:hypothetical protein